MTHFALSWPWKSKPGASQAAQDALWVAAYTQGFTNAWAMMLPLMMDGVTKTQDALRTQAINETLERLAPTHQLYTAQTVSLRGAVELLKKREEFRLKAEQAVGAEGEKYRHYVTALDWALAPVTNGH